MDDNARPADGTSEPLIPSSGQPQWTAPTSHSATGRRRTGRRAGLAALAGGTAAALVFGGVALAHRVDAGTSSTQASAGTATSQLPSGATARYGWGSNYGWRHSSSGTSGSGMSGSGTSGSGMSGSGTSGSGAYGSGDSTGSVGSTGTSVATRSATTGEEAGVVDITTVLDYGTGEAAGTGIVLTSTGEILTNNHVVDEATKISVTVVSTGRTYTAAVVGTDPTDDVAVLQLANASGLTTAKLGTSTAVKVGDAITAVGNAGGTGGTPTAAPGTVVAVNQSITAGDDSGSNTEQLTGMIEVNAGIQAGDSGGPLYAKDGSVVGIDTAASSSEYATTTIGFAIPIAKATAIATRIESGVATSTIHIGNPAFLGVELSPYGATGGATISGVVRGSAAATAGLQAGDTITAVGGSAVDSADTLSGLLAKHQANDKVSITWTDSGGQSHTATVALGSGPAD